MKSNKILALLGLLLIPAMAFAQDNWVHDESFIPDTANGDQWFEVHGLAVDGEGKIWIQSYYWNQTDLIVNRDLNDDGVPDTVSSNVIYVYNPDGTPADISPIAAVEYDDGTPADTLYRSWNGESYEAMSGRGLATDPNGDVIISSYNRLFKVDHTTGKGLARVVHDGAGNTAPTVDAAGNIYIADVSPGGTITMYDNNLENPTVLIDESVGYSRDFQVSPDGNTIWWAGYSNGAVYRYTRPDEFSGFNTIPDTLLRGMAVESFDIHPVTGYLWASAGSLNDTPDAPWQPQTWYAFDYAELDPETTPVPVDSIRWVKGAGVEGEYGQARPRGIDFSLDGTVAYVAGFSATDTEFDVQKFTTDQVFTSNENEGVAELPKGFELEQNYPNPFNPTTNINYSIDQAGAVTLKVYDMTGREVATLVNERMSAGSHQVTFDASNLSSGVYLYSLQANGVRLTNKMTLIK